MIKCTQSRRSEKTSLMWNMSLLCWTLTQHDQLWPQFYLLPYKVVVWVLNHPSQTGKLLLGPEDPLSIIHESSGWTLGTSWTRPCVNTKHWPPQWALPPTTLLTDTNTKELKGVPLRSHTHWRMSQCAAAQSCVCTVYTAFVHGHCSPINGGWSVDENQKERTSLWMPARVHVH